MIRMEHVSFSYSDQGPTVQDVSFHVEKGEFAAILGANGAGKTTTVRLIDGLINPVPESGPADLQEHRPGRDPFRAENSTRRGRAGSAECPV